MRMTAIPTTASAIITGNYPMMEQTRCEVGCLLRCTTMNFLTVYLLHGSTSY